MNDNPFAPPEAVIDTAPRPEEALGPGAEKAAQHLRRTASWLLFFGVWGLLIGAAQVSIATKKDPLDLDGLLWALVFLSIGALEVTGGAALWAWRRWSRPVALGGLAPLLAVFPVGSWIALRGTIELLGREAAALFALAPEVLARRLEGVKLAPRSPIVPIISPPVIIGVVVLITYLATHGLR